MHGIDKLKTLNSFFNMIMTNENAMMYLIEIDNIVFVHTYAKYCLAKAHLASFVWRVNIGCPLFCSPISPMMGGPHFLVCVVGGGGGGGG